jgi:hypothetical protein
MGSIFRGDLAEALNIEATTDECCEVLVKSRLVGWGFSAESAMMPGLGDHASVRTPPRLLNSVVLRRSFVSDHESLQSHDRHHANARPVMTLMSVTVSDAVSGRSDKAASGHCPRRRIRVSLRIPRPSTDLLMLKWLLIKKAARRQDVFLPMSHHLDPS